MLLINRIKHILSFSHETTLREYSNDSIQKFLKDKINNGKALRRLAKFEVARCKDWREIQDL